MPEQRVPILGAILSQKEALWWEAMPQNLANQTSIQFSLEESVCRHNNTLAFDSNAPINLHGLCELFVHCGRHLCREAAEKKGDAQNYVA